MITFNNIIEHLETKPKAVFMSDRPSPDDDYKFYEIGIQQSFPKYPKRFLNIFELKDKNILGIYFRHPTDQESELYDKYDWIEKSEIKGYSCATFNENSTLKEVQLLIDQSYEIVLSSLTKTEQKMVDNIKSERNLFFLFDELAHKFKDSSKYIFVKYQREIELTHEAKCLIRFENNSILDMKSREQSKDYMNWEKIIENAILSNT